MKQIKSLFIFCTGILLGYLLSEKRSSHRPIPPEKALDHAKLALEKHVSIHSSWIYVKQEKIIRKGLPYNTYRGGICRLIHGKQHLYIFYVDCLTGAIIDINPPLDEKTF